MSPLVEVAGARGALLEVAPAFDHEDELLLQVEGIGDVRPAVAYFEAAEVEQLRDLLTAALDELRRRRAIDLANLVSLDGRMVSRAELRRVLVEEATEAEEGAA